VSAGSPALAGRDGDADDRAVRRLLRWYPRSWRERYGEEFAELLRAELAEQPRSWRRTADVARSGLLARCTIAGLTSHRLSPVEQARAGLATLGCALAALATVGVAMLAQLATGWQWAVAPSAPAAAGTALMAAATVLLSAVALAAAAPLAWQAAVAIRRGDRALARPAGLAVACALLLVNGARHFQNGWPGTGGTGAHHGLVPAGLAAFGWASTLSVSSYWAHPALLGRFPAAELAWMGASPLAAAGLVVGVVLVLRRLRLSPRLTRYQARLAAWASVAAAGFLAGAASWVLGREQGPAALRPGLLNGAELVLMAVALAVALRAAAGIRRAR
jgi:hypothetical protein